ncbi:hypothetical protein COT49_02020 [candidate division WWE3 bacterium CG08_land_8_20_14_0_20_40_13]|uniref:Nucleotidyl transferase AbiEii/AbiGii toxin family protein n=1 Tax=candidate division WWE3 bacterium CG08_land_8_20_14_0_20_40_13 TaxID=1975084 RepID=A0A2H0XDT7_UNCKA|nr:MAG: hypothetical protein COT49_02020 [candidate division WWE3 bacterium CG08_land_8_20_14_0_20_40_13]
MSSIYLEILDNDRRAIFKKLSNFKDRGYLAGGTALALQINHRKSYDFDIFLGKPISRFFVRDVKNIFGEIKIVSQSGDQLSIFTKENIKIDFVYYWYKRIDALINTTSIGLAGILDIVADKAATIGRRAVWRDYIDIYFILKLGIFDLSKIISLGKEKFGGEFNDALFLEQLVYFKDLQITDAQFIGDSVPEKDIKEYLERTVREYSKI